MKCYYCGDNKFITLADGPIPCPVCNESYAPIHPRRYHDPNDYNKGHHGHPERRTGALRKASQPPIKP